MTALEVCFCSSVNNKTCNCKTKENEKEEKIHYKIKLH